MKCLTDVQIQQLADAEAPEEHRRHVASCASCSARLRERERLIGAAVEAIDVPLAVPPSVTHRVERALAEGATRGATRLRPAATASPWRRMAWSAAAVTAATVITLVVIGPFVNGPSTVSASEVLARSATRLAEQVSTGIEFLEYDLTLDGVPREMMPEHVDGAYRVKQVIDHDHPGRYAMSTYDAAGQLQSLITQDPARRRRVMMVRLEDRLYRFDFTVDAHVPFSPPEIERLHMEAVVAMMQASGNHQLQIVQGADGLQYRIEMPGVSGLTSKAMWDLSEAQVLVDADDWHIVEFAVKGSFLKQPYSVSYRLTNRSIVGQDAALDSAFEAPDDPAAIRIQGEGSSAIPARDALVLALRELGRVKQGR